MTSEETDVIEPEVIQEPIKRPIGRPSLYQPQYCNQVVDYMAQGKTLVAFAALIDVHIDTLYEWQSEHPQFSEACQRARQKQQAYWEAKIESGLDRREFQASAALTFMRALFPHYREALSNSPNVAVQVNNSADPQLLATAKDVFKMLAAPPASESTTTGSVQVNDNTGDSCK